MNHIGHHAPNHEPVGFIYPDRREITVPWDEPAKGSAFVHFELFNGEFAIYEGDDEVAVRGFYLPVNHSEVTVKMPASFMLSPETRT